MFLRLSYVQVPLQSENSKCLQSMTLAAPQLFGAFLHAFPIMCHNIGLNSY
jgi:hypothetical protein